jgi:hypothetical protein
MVNKEKVFHLFENEELTLEEVQISLREEPFTKIGMFTKIIANHTVFHNKLDNLMKSSNPDYDINITKAASEFTVYNRAYFYISQIDTSDKYHLEALLEFKTEPFLNALKLAINFFQREDIEQYEKCAVLHKILVIKEKSETFKKNLDM